MPYLVVGKSFYRITCNMCKKESSKKAKSVRKAWFYAYKIDGYYASVYRAPWDKCLCPKCNAEAARSFIG